MNPNYSLVALRARHRCEYCHAPESVFNFPFEVEHIIPLTREGANDESNLALACRSCNIYKGSSIIGVDPATDTAAPLFHPREQDWESNFVIDMTTGMIVGLSASACATIIRLRMNSQAQVMARQQWIVLGLFP
ncbi:MAG: HNH endonuclease signature motif containing protein [Caldilineaceae bacterium]